MIFFSMKQEMDEKTSEELARMGGKSLFRMDVL